VIMVIVLKHNFNKLHNTFIANPVEAGEFHATQIPSFLDTI